VTESDSDSSRANPLVRVIRSPWLWVPLALLIVARAVLPFALERAIPWLAKRESGADVKIENIDLGLLSGWVRIEGLRVASPFHPENAATPAASPSPQATAAAVATPEPTATAPAQAQSEPDLLSLAQLELELDWLPLLSGEVSLPRIQLDGLALRAHQKRDGSIALPTPPPSKANEGAASPTSPEPAGSAPPPDTVSESTSPHEAPPETSETDAGADESAGWKIRIAHFGLGEPDFALYSERTGGEVAHLTLKRFAVEALSAGPAGFGLEQIEIEDPDVFVDRDWMLDPGFAGSGKEAPKGESRPPALQIARLAIDSGRFQIRTSHGPIEAAIRIELLEFDTAPGHTFPISIQLELGEGGASLHGLLGIFPPAFDAEFSWHDLRVSPYMVLAAPAIVPGLAPCKAEGRVDLSFRSEEPAQLAFRGESRLLDLAFRQPETGELALEAKQIAVQIRDAVLPLSAGQPQRVDLASLTIAKPKVVFTNPPDALDALLASFSTPRATEEPAADEQPADETASAPGSPAEPSTPERKSSPAVAVQIDKLQISDGELVFVDRSVKPRHETRVRDFRLAATGVTSSPPGAGRIESAGVIQRKGTFEIQGKLPGGNGSLRVKVRRLDLAGYDGYARKARLHVDSGDASLESKLKIRDGRVKADNDLILHDLRVDSTTPGAFTETFGLSLDVALALLRGPRGDIDLALPVTIDKGGAGIGMAALIRSAFQEALKGALTSPLKLVGGLLPRGSAPASLEPIAFESGAAELDAMARKRIAPLVDLLKDRPDLGFTVSGQTAPEDEPGLALAMLQDRAVAGEGLPPLEGAGFFARRRLTSALRERAEGGEGRLDAADEALLSRYVAAQQVPKERYEALATARAQSIVDALSAAGAPAGALTVGPPGSADAPGVVVELALRAPEQTGSSE